MSYPSAVNNVLNMHMLKGQSIKAQTNIPSSTFIFVSSITDSKTNRICKLNCFLANAKSIVSKVIEHEEYVFEYNPDVIILSES